MQRNFWAKYFGPRWPNFEFFGPNTQCRPNLDPCRVSLHSIRLPSSCRPRIFWRYIFCISIIFAQVCSLRNHQRPTAVLPCVRAGQQGQQYFDVFEFWLFWNFFLMAGNMKMNYRNVCATTFTQPRIVLRLRFPAVFIFYQKRSKAENWNLAHFADAPFGMAMRKVLDEWNYPTKNLTSTISIAQSREEVLQLYCI